MPKCVSFMRRCVENAKEQSISVTLNSKGVRPFASYEGTYPKHNMLEGKTTPNMINI